METSQRQLRVGELIRHAVSEAFSRGDLRDPLLEGAFITVPEVRMSPDLKVATVLVMPLGGRDRDATLKALERERGPLRNALKKRVKLKFLPELRFALDTRFDDDDKINALMAAPGIRRDLARTDGSEDEHED